VQSNQTSKLELLEIDPLFDSEGWKYVTVAVDGVPASPFAFHKSVYDLYPDDDAFLAYLSRQGKAMIERGLIKGQEHLVQSPEPGVN
jgi:hypothetical protein